MTEIDTKRFQERLLNLQSRVRDEIEQLQETMREDQIPPGEHEQFPKPTDDPHKAITLDQNEEKISREIAAALERIENGTFGTCVDCGAELSAERLEAIPYTPYCIHCEQKHEAEGE